MKKIIIIVATIFVINIIAVGQCYQRPNEDRYLTQNDYGISMNLDQPYLCQIGSNYFGADKCFVYDVAQPHYSDSLLTIVGVSALLWYHQYRNMNAYLCIADTNFYMHRVIKIPSVATYDCNYTEVFFEEPINVYGRFMVILDNPKPRGYESLDYNNYTDTTGTITSKTSLQFLGGPNEQIPYDYNSYLRRLYKTEDSLLYINWSRYDTTLFSLSGYERMTAFLFPIFGELDTTLECIGSRQNNSGIKDMSMVEKYTNIFPKPAVDEVNVLCSFKIKSIEIYNILGNQILSKVVNAYNTKINTASLSKGNYILRVKTSSGIVNKKIVVE